MTSIAPAFPGSWGEYSDQAATVTAPYVARHERQRRERPKRAGRMRKPNRLGRGAVLERASQAIAVVAVAFTVGAVLAQLAQGA